MKHKNKIQISKWVLYIACYNKYMHLLYCMQIERIHIGQWIHNRCEIVVEIFAFRYGNIWNTHNAIVVKIKRIVAF